MRLESYSRALAEEFRTDADTLYVMDRLVRTRRGEYEAKIADMGDLLEMVRERRAERIAAIREQRMREEYEAYMRDVREHPENYSTMERIYDEFNASRSPKPAIVPAT